MKAKAQTLFHFTKDIEVLQKILIEGFWPRYSLEDFRWQIVEPTTDHAFAAFPMVCFCDIPLSRIDEHVGFYGHYGVGLSRAWGEQAGLNPLLYIANINSLAKSLLDLANVSRRYNSLDSALAAYHLHHMASFTKPISGQMTIDGEQVEKDFYQESEWRYVPNHRELPQFLSRTQFLDGESLVRADQNARNVAMLPFTPNDVRYIFVQFDSEIPAIINFIQSALDMHSSADIKMLMSRVTSLETVRADW